MDADDKLLMSFASDRLRQCDENYMLTNTKFLDVRQQSVIFGHFSRDSRCDMAFYGGFDGAERAVCVFAPRGCGIADGAVSYFRENSYDDPLSLVRIHKDRFSGVLTHRDYLGALMALGIKREMVGDIIVADDGCDVIVISSVAGYIAENLASAGRANVKAEAVSLPQVREPQLRLEEKFCSVASMRLDVIVGAIFDLSRSKATEAISAGLVFVNGRQTEKTDYRTEQGDKLVLRGSGKAVLDSINGQSKKGRLRLTVKLYK